MNIRTKTNVFIFATVVSVGAFVSLKVFLNEKEEAKEGSLHCQYLNNPIVLPTKGRINVVDGYFKFVNEDGRKFITNLPCTYVQD